jgi:hypothetical protein
MFQGGSPRLSQLRTVSFWPRWQVLICTNHLSGFMGPSKPSSPIPTLSNRPSLFWGGLLEVEWGSPEWWLGQALLGAKTSSREQRSEFDLARTSWTVVVRETPGGGVYDVSVKFFTCVVYIDSSHHDTPAYEWLLLRCYHLMVFLVVLMVWISVRWLRLYYHDDYCIYFTFDVDMGQHSACLCMF